MVKTSGKDRRIHRRIDARIKVSFKSTGEFIEEYTKNLSRGGIFLKTDKLLDPNARIELMMVFPNSKKEHKIIGKVTRLVVMSHPESEDKQIYGVGIHFLKMEDRTMEAIDEIYKKSREED